jgi:hypothetical protein
MLMGLLQGQEKMSKSDPNSAIFMEDSEADVSVKIKKAYCPPGVVEANPCLEYIRYVILPWFSSFEITRKEENGGTKCVSRSHPASVDAIAIASSHSWPRDLQGWQGPPPRRRRRGGSGFDEARVRGICGAGCTRCTRSWRRTM